MQRAKWEGAGKERNKAKANSSSVCVCVCVTQSENKYRYMDIEHMLCFGGVRGEWTDTLYRPLCTWVRRYGTITPGFATQMLPVLNRSHKWLKLARWELWGGMQKACTARGDNHILNLVICYLEGLRRSQKFIFLHKMLFAITHTHTLHKGKKKKVRSASHKVHSPCKPWVCNLHFRFHSNDMIFYLFIFREDYTGAWVFEVGWKSRQSPN